MKTLKKNIYFPILFLALIISCNKSGKTEAEQKTDSITRKNLSENTENGTANDTSHAQSEFSKTGAKISDFVPKAYEIQYEAEGDLNQDGLSDAAVVLRKKTDTLAERTVLILLKNGDKTYHLDKISKKVFPAEYNEDNYKIYDTEDISIDKGQLSINLYASGPSGNLLSTFKYLNRNLILTYIETYNMGAGSHQALYYEVMKGNLTQEVVNTMEEEMLSKSKTFHLNKKQLLFEDTSPEEVIQKAYHSIDSEET
ncbi:hypothetical protein M2347_002537 [Chryseobacterium sp. H1D6B]|uniref:hypothetical protein n=1 Tax=Chryseobacterium sp. H1D6B TaxID=2940588 RepID=UPI0015CB5A47|nr:hypothetical protein [Chryseobacterium sp. H1D6B]MDH6252810.1 hypothetical protein [Chryseobacterium sp. H1D6B]